MTGERARGAVVAQVVAAVAVAVGVVMMMLGLRPASAPEPSAPVAAVTATTPTSLAPAPRGTATAATGKAAAQVRVPVRLAIPSLGVDARLHGEHVESDGGLSIPEDPQVIGTWSTGDDPRWGTLVLAGHVNYRGELGALHELADVKRGAVIELVGDSGERGRWRVVDVDVRHKEDLPTFPVDGARRLAIVTCGGPVVRTPKGRGYRDNVIAWAEPA